MAASNEGFTVKVRGTVREWFHSISSFSVHHNGRFRVRTVCWTRVRSTSLRRIDWSSLNSEHSMLNDRNQLVNFSYYHSNRSNWKRNYHRCKISTNAIDRSVKWICTTSINRNSIKVSCRSRSSSISPTEMLPIAAKRSSRKQERRKHVNHHRSSPSSHRLKMRIENHNFPVNHAQSVVPVQSAKNSLIIYISQNERKNKILVEIECREWEKTNTGELNSIFSEHGSGSWCLGATAIPSVSDRIFGIAIVIFFTMWRKWRMRWWQWWSGGWWIVNATDFHITWMRSSLTQKEDTGENQKRDGNRSSDRYAEDPTDCPPWVTRRNSTAIHSIWIESEQQSTGIGRWFRTG